MNTLYQKSTKINIFHAHTLYIYMYIFYMQTLLIQSTATTRLVLDAENWLVQFKFGNSLWEFWEILWVCLRDSAQAVKNMQMGLWTTVVRLFCHCHLENPPPSPERRVGSSQQCSSSWSILYKNLKIQCHLFLWDSSHLIYMRLWLLISKMMQEGERRGGGKDKIN